MMFFSPCHGVAIDAFFLKSFRSKPPAGDQEGPSTVQQYYSTGSMVVPVVSTFRYRTTGSTGWYCTVSSRTCCIWVDYRTRVALVHTTT